MSGWDHLFGGSFWANWAMRPPLPIVLDWIAGLRRSGVRRVYDLGCGMGRHTLLLAQQGFEVTASDTSPRAVEATRRGLTEQGLRGDVILADMHRIPLDSGHFDAVLSIGVLEHTTREGMQTAIGEIRRVLRPGGQVLASFVPRTRWISKDEPGRDMLEDNTLRSYGPEESTHHLVDEAELRELFAQFQIQSLTMQREQGTWGSSAEWFVLAQSAK